MTQAPTVQIIGRGRAGGAFALALRQVGWRVPSPRGRGLCDRPIRADVVLLAVPDAAIAEVARRIVPGPVVLHCSGASQLDVLACHDQRGSIHPLVSMPSPEVGAERLLAGGWFAVAGHHMADQMVSDLGGRPVTVSDDQRVVYHAAAAIAANHFVALMGQVERVAAGVGLPLEAFLDLARGSFDDVAAVGPTAALTGPVSRGDWMTVRRHLDALGQEERAAYRAMADQAARLAGREPDWRNES